MVLNGFYTIPTGRTILNKRTIKASYGPGEKAVKAAQESDLPVQVLEVIDSAKKKKGIIGCWWT
jgi:hypothetical protein